MADLKVVDLNAKSIGDRNEVSEVLKEAIAQNFDEVIIFGFYTGDNQVYMKRSKIVSTIKIIGALEFAKQWLYGTK